MRPLVLSLFLLSGLLLAGCSPAPLPPAETPLFDGAHTPDILTESRHLERPGDLGGNRFVKGWWPRKHEKEPWLAPEAQGVRLEFVHLGEGPRVLILATDLLEKGEGAEVDIRIAGQEIATLPIAERLEIPLPADLPLGRVPMEFTFRGPRIVVKDGGFDRALAAGDVEISGQDLVQAGFSLVDVVRPVRAGAELIGRFEPPRDARAGQSFHLLIEDGSGHTRTAFEWQAGGWAPFSAGSHNIEVALEEGWVRVRLLARGEGPPARWIGLGLNSVDETPVETTSVEPPAQPQVVIVYIPDALRRDYVGHLGGPEGISPYVDRLAAEGATFTDHMSVAPNTTPSTKSLFTGHLFLTQGGWKLPIDGPATLAERFAEAGYRTGLFTGNANVTQDYGLTRGFEVAPRRILFSTYSTREKLIYNDSAVRVHEVVLQWLDQLSPEEKVFLHIQTIHPHNPYDPPPGLRDRFTAGIDSSIDGSTQTLFDIRQSRRKASEADRNRVRGLYAGGFADNDAELALLMEEIVRRYPPGEVLLVVTSDHGEELFEHGGVLHGYTLYEEQLQIPLIFWWPGQIQPAAIEAATDNIDLHATLNALVGAPPVPEGGGRSLWPLLAGHPQSGKKVRFAAASSVNGGIFSARSRNRKVIWAPRVGNKWGMGQALGRRRDAEYVFDLKHDPGETDNLVGYGDLEAAWLRSRLLAWVEVGKQLEVGVPVDDLDPETVKSLKALGYLQ